MPQMSAINWLIMLILFSSILFIINAKLSHLQRTGQKSFSKKIVPLPLKLSWLW